MVKLGQLVKASTPAAAKVPSSAVQFIVDLIIVAAGWGLVLVSSNITIEEIRSNERSMALTFVATAVTLLILERRGLYQGRPTVPRTDEISRVFVAVLGGAASVVVAAAFLNWLIGAWELAIGAVLVFAGRTLIRRLLPF